MSVQNTTNIILDITYLKMPHNNDFHNFHIKLDTVSNPEMA